MQAGKNPSKITRTFLEDAGPLLIHRAAALHVVRDTSGHRTVKLADEAIDAVADIHHSADPAELKQHGKRTRKRVEDFIETASADIR